MTNNQIKTELIDAQGCFKKVDAETVSRRASSIKKPMFKLDTSDGSVYSKDVNVITRAYNEGATPFALSVLDNDKKGVEIECLLFYKQAPFPQDVYFMYALSNRLRTIVDMIDDDENLLARECTTDELNAFNMYYLYTPQLIDTERREIQNTLNWMQELALHGSILVLKHECLNLINYLQNAIYPFVKDPKSKTNCCLDTIYSLSDDVVELKQSRGLNPNEPEFSPGTELKSDLVIS